MIAEIVIDNATVVARMLPGTHSCMVTRPTTEPATEPETHIENAIPI
jgi:hypothetical protein